MHSFSSFLRKRQGTKIQIHNDHKTNTKIYKNVIKENLLLVLFSLFAGDTPLKKEINTPPPEREFFGKKSYYQNIY